METIWLKLKDAEKLGMPLRTLNYKCANNLFVCRKVSSRGKKGFAYEVSLNSLPKNCQEKHFEIIKNQKEKDSNQSIPTDLKLSITITLNIMRGNHE